MKKYLLLIVSLFLIILLSSCDTTDMVFENHDYHKSYNKVEHYDLCDCGEIKNEEAHEYADPVIKKEATCDETGIQKEECIVCGYIKETIIPKKTHKFNEWEVSIEATCISVGQMKRSCVNCGYEEYKDTNKIAHTKTSYTDIASDCIHEGHIGGSYCSFCNQELEPYTIVGKVEHTYDEWKTIEEATCTSVGSTERKCVVCGNTEHKVIEKLPHTKTLYEDDLSTCNHKGYTGGAYCSVCNQVLEERTELDYAPHAYGEWETVKEPTCTSIGTSERKCIVCGNTEQQVLEKIPHIEESYIDDESTCIYKGHIGGTYCKECGQVIVERTELDYSSHTYGEWEIIKEPTCTSIGTSERKCIICGNTEQQVLEKTPHIEESYIDDESSCIHKGHTGGTYCKECGQVIVEMTELDYAPHTYGEWEITKEPTCSSIGSSERKCTICGNTEHKELDKLDHTIKSYEDDPSTCIHEGHTGGTYCSVCNQVLEERTKLNLSSHTYGDWIITDNPTCIALGHAKRVCEICGNTEYKDLEMIPHKIKSYDTLEANCQHEGHIGGTYCEACNQELTPYTIVGKTEHSFGEWVISLDPTCISKGQERRICNDCLKEEFRDTNMIAHTETPYTDLEATCEHEGHIGGTYCSFCHKELSAYTITAKTSHTYGDWEVIQSPTCISKGQAKHICSVCGYEDYKELSITEHTVTPYPELKATCQHEGHVGGTYCSFCNQELTPYTKTSKTSHTYGDWEEIQSPTCISKGQAKRVCTVCGYEDFKELDMISHNATPYEDLEANCQHEGHIGGTYCSFCNQELTPYIVVDKTAHKYGEWEVVSASTCITKGQSKKECSVCHHETFKETEMKEHTPIDGTPVASTCTTHGHTAGKYCSFCGLELEAPEELALIAHDYSVEVVTKPATYIDSGTKRIQCSHCSNYIEATIDRLPLTSAVWNNSLTEESAHNKAIEFFFEDTITNEDYDAILSNKGSYYYLKSVDNHISKVYEYYTNTNYFVETLLDDYKHGKYNVVEDKYLNKLDLLLWAISNTSHLYNDVIFDEENKYFRINGVQLTNHRGVVEESFVGIKIDGDGNLINFAISTPTYSITIAEITSSSQITLPGSSYHNFKHTGNDHECDYCHAKYNLYESTKDNYHLYYYQNKTNVNDLQFEYELIDSTQEDVNFLSPSYYKNGNLIRFTSLYYEGYTPIQPKVVISYSLSNTKVLTIKYADNSTEMLLLLNDNTCIRVNSNSKSSGNAYSSTDIQGKTFELNENGVIRRYFIQANNNVVVKQYKEINYYIYNNIKTTDFNSQKLESIFNKTYSSYSDGVKHNGTNGYIYFKLTNTFDLTIYYEGISDSLKAFSAITVKNISGNPTDFKILFMGDNEYYELHYNSNVTITKK